MNFSASAAAYKLIKHYEGLALNAYLCPANKLTIGYGHVVLPGWDYLLFSPMKPSSLERIVGQCQRLRGITAEAKTRLRITQDQADTLLKKDVLQTEHFLNSTLKETGINQAQFDALVSFVFNLGAGNFARSTLKQKIKSGDFTGAAREFDRWVYATQNGKKIKLRGLIKRRKDERILFLSQSEA